MITYLMRFAVSLCAILWHVAPRHGGHREAEMLAIAADIATTDCSAIECLELMGTPALESGWERTAVGKAGERGAWQIMPPAPSYGAREALRRMRTQGWLGFVGCSRHTEKCDQLILNRTLPAAIFLATFPPESSLGSGSEIASAAGP
jgi:hypothetical protein